MEMDKEIITEESPIDTSTYFDGKPGIKEELKNIEEIGSFSFVDGINAMKELNLYE